MTLVSPEEWDFDLASKSKADGQECPSYTLKEKPKHETSEIET